MIVHGNGDPVTEDERRARSPRTPAEIGVGLAEFQFASEMRSWEYDKLDTSVRLDVHAGMLEELILAAELDGMDHPTFGGSRVGGSRVGGSRVGGSRVGGSRVGGSRVGGSRVGGGGEGG